MSPFGPRCLFYFKKKKKFFFVLGRLRLFWGICERARISQLVAIVTTRCAHSWNRSWQICNTFLSFVVGFYYYYYYLFIVNAPSVSTHRNGPSLK